MSADVCQSADQWQPAHSMPYGKVVVVLTVKGLIRLAKRKTFCGHRGFERVHCSRVGRNADLVAVKWKPTESDPDVKWWPK